MPEYLLYLFIFIVSSIGSAIQAATGFGYGIFVMAVLPFFLPYGDALCTTGIIAIFTSLVIALKHKEYFNWRLIATPIVACLIVSPLGTAFLRGHADDFLRRILGGFLILLSLYLLFVSGRLKIRANPVTGFVAGGVGGLTSSLFGMGGPPIVLYLISATTVPAVYIANIQIYFFCSSLYVSGVRFFHGMMNANVLIYTLCGFLGIFGGAKLGDALFRRLDEKSLRRTIYLFMIVMGMLFLFR